MDARRILSAAALAGPLGGCALASALAGPPKLSLPAWTPVPPPRVAPPGAASAAPRSLAASPAAASVAAMAPIPDPPARGPQATAAQGVETGPDAIADANRLAREPSRAGAFLGGVQVFVYEPGRVYEVWTAPLRVTTLTLGEGEAVVAKAAGDTVRWQIGETTSGEGAAQRAHVMIKPLTRGLETNLALTTNRRLYLIQLRSGPAAAFNAAVTWDLGAVLPRAGETTRASTAPAAAPTLSPAALLDARFAIKTKGRRPDWTPAAVMTDGVRTYLSFPATAAAAEAPALFAVDPSGEVQMVNYRQQGGLWVVDRVLDRAELRLGGRRGKVVEIRRLEGAS